MSYDSFIKALQGFDTSPILLTLLSTSTVLYMCANSINVVFPYQSTENGHEMIPRPNKTNIWLLSTTVLSSIILLAIYYFPSFFNIFRIILFFIGVLPSASILWHWFHLFLKGKICKIVSLLASALISALCWITSHWLITNFFSICICVSSVNEIKISSFKIAVFVSIVFIVFDFFWIFFSPLLFDDNVIESAMKNVLQSHQPTVITIPINSPGEILIPGMVLDFLIRFDLQNSSNLFPIALCGYMVGIFACFSISYVFQINQHALLCVLPSVFSMTILAALCQNLLGKLWKCDISLTARLTVENETNNNNNNSNNSTDENANNNNVLFIDSSSESSNSGDDANQDATSEYNKTSEKNEILKNDDKGNDK